MSRVQVIRLFLIGTLLWSGLLLSATGSRVLRDSAREADWLFGLLAIVGVGLSIAALRPACRSREPIALALGSTLFSLLLLDGLVAAALALFPPARDHATYAQRIGVPFDSRSKLEVMDAMRAEGGDPVPHIHPCNVLRSLRSQKRLDFIPLAGISNATTVYGNEGGEYLIYESDRYGFNNAKDLWTRGAARVALIGDSFTVGAYVDPSRNIAGALERSGESTLNLGVGCTGPLMSLARLKEYAAPLQPEVVVWIHYEGNDLRELEFEKTFTELLLYLNDGHSQGLMAKQRSIDQLLRAHAAQKESRARARIEREQRSSEGIGNALPARLLRLTHLRAISRSATEYREGTFFELGAENPEVALLGQVLEEARRTTDSWGGELWFVYLPSYHRYAKAVDHDTFHARADVIAEAQRQSIPVIDLHDSMGQHEDPLGFFPLRTAGHYSPEGYEFVAEQIARAMAAKR